MAHHTDPLELLTDILLEESGTDHSRHAAMLLADHMLCVREGWPTDARLGGSAKEIAAANAGWSSARDRDDVDWDRLVHAGSVVWPVILAEGREKEISGSRALRAAHAGYEAAARSAEVLGRAHRERFHPTATAGLVAAAVASSVISEHTPEQTATAIGHALSVMGGSAGALRERSGTRQFHRSHAVRSGMAAAEAAGAGLDATRRDLIEGGGLLEPLDDFLLARSGGDAIAQASIRVYPTSGWNQCAFEAASAAASRIQGRSERILVETTPQVVAAAAAGEGAVDEHWLSLRWAVAAASLPGSEHDEIRRTTEQVEIVERDEPGAAVTISTADRTARYEVTVPLGHPHRPASVADLAGKWGLPLSRMDDLIRGIDDAWANGPGVIGLIDELFQMTCELLD